MTSLPTNWCATCNGMHRRVSESAHARSRAGSGGMGGRAKHIGHASPGLGDERGLGLAVDQRQLRLPVLCRALVVVAQHTETYGSSHLTAIMQLYRRPRCTFRPGPGSRHLLRGGRERLEMPLIGGRDEAVLQRLLGSGL